MIAGMALAIAFCWRVSAQRGRKTQCQSRDTDGAFLALAGEPTLPSQARDDPARDRHTPREQQSTDKRNPGRLAVVPSARVGLAHRGTADDDDVEIRRIEVDLERISRDAGARQAFYDQMDRLVDCVRNGRQISPALTVEAGWPAPPPSVARGPSPPAFSSGSISIHPPLQGFLGSLSPPAPQPVVPRFAVTIQPITSPQGSAMNPRVVSRLIYWARRNRCPPELALATAWQESRMSPRPPDGSSGEIGIMQILPARARAEGVNPRRLRNPDVDMWLGTKLLARYYQEEGNVTGAAMKYVAGPGVFEHSYPADVGEYIRWYSRSVRAYANYFAQYISF
jgi:hypothetical protein